MKHMAQLKGLKLNANGIDAGLGLTEPRKSRWYDGINLGDILNKGSVIYSDTLKRQTDADNAAAAIQLEKLKIQQAQANAQAAQASSSGVVAKVKAYAVPIAITGAVVIGGIAAYFYFKKK
jgi:hypothetical protein